MEQIVHPTWWDWSYIGGSVVFTWQNCFPASGTHGDVEHWREVAAWDFPKGFESTKHMAIPRCACFQHAARSAYCIKAQNLLNGNLPGVIGNNGVKFLEDEQWYASVLVESSTVNKNILAGALNFQCCFSVALLKSLSWYTSPSSHL